MANDSKNEKYAYLNRLSTEQLEELLRADIESSESGDEDVIFHILEVIEKREEETPTGRLPDEDKAWAEFQQYYNIPEGKGRSLYPVEDEAQAEWTQTISTQKNRRIRGIRIWRKFGTVAAAIVVFSMVVIGAQAAGIDVFGALGRWTNETFHFVTSSTGDAQGGVETDKPMTPRDNGYYISLQEALNKCGITENLAPTRYPGEFEMSEPKISSTDLGEKISCSFSSSENKFFKIQVFRYHLRSELDSHAFEKDSSNVSTYNANGKTFYIISNVDTTIATWSDSNSLVLSIAGNLSEDDMKAIIDSIGG